MFELIVYPILGFLGEKFVHPDAEGDALMGIAMAQFPGVMKKQLALGKASPDENGDSGKKPVALDGLLKTKGDNGSPAAPSLDSLLSTTSEKPESPTAPVKVPVAATEPTKAARLAQLVYEDLKKNGAQYSRKAMAEFQRLAGLKADGDYGPKTAGALRFYSGKSDSPESFPKYRGRGQPGILPYVPVK